MEKKDSESCKVCSVGKGAGSADDCAEHMKCALCKELRGVVKISDPEGLELRICLRCDRLIDWR